MRARWEGTASLPIPNKVPAKVILQHVQSCIPWLQAMPSVTSFEEVSPNVDEIADDPYFDQLDENLRSFVVREVVYLAPGLAKDVRWPVIVQLKPDGLRSRSNIPAGVTCWTTWTVRQRQETRDDSSPASESTFGSAETAVSGEPELFGELTIEGNRLLMPFVTWRSKQMLQLICQGLVEGGVRSYLKMGL